MFLTRTKKQVIGLARHLEAAGIPYATPQTMDNVGWGAGKFGRIPTRTALYNAITKLEGVDTPESARRGFDDFSEAPEYPTKAVLTGDEAAALLDHTRANYLKESRSDMEDNAAALRGSERRVTTEDLTEYVKPTFWKKYTLGAGAVPNCIKGDLSDRDRNAVQAALRVHGDPVDPDHIPTRLYTIHASKGAEARTVVVYDGITGRIADEIEINEEAYRNEYRTWYVALTRAKSNLFVLRDGFEWTEPFLPESLTPIAEEGYAEGEAADGPDGTAGGGSESGEVES
jgi:DNA helicase-2/ATP-dependent DNA helicase PcrA